MSLSTEIDDDEVGPITSEFIANLNSGLSRTITRAGSAPMEQKKHGDGEFRTIRRSYKRSREDVTSRSRTEIINWVLSNEDLIKVCICPYCLKIHSRRDNARVHIKNQHPGMELRDFDREIDASLEEVRNVNNLAKFSRVLEKRPRVASPIPTTNGHQLQHQADNFLLKEDEESEDIKPFTGSVTLQNFLINIDNQVRRQQELKELKELKELNGTGEAGTSETVLESVKNSREPSPQSSLLEELNGTSPSSSPAGGPSSSLLPFGCVICPCSFPRVHDLTVHVGQVHRTRFRCNTCLAEFVQAVHLEQHFMFSHSGENGNGSANLQ